MEKTDKSAEDILRKHGLGITSILSASGEYSTIDAMHEFAAQQLSEYKKMIEKLLMIYEDSCLNPNDRFYPKEVYKSTIGKAKKLIEK